MSQIVSRVVQGNVITNVGDSIVDCYGDRWRVLSIGQTIRITSESCLFAQDLTPDEFARWFGTPTPGPTGASGEEGE